MTKNRPYLRAREEFAAAAAAMFENVIYYRAADGRWYSRNPETTQWANDRMRGRRFLLLRQLAQPVYDDPTASEADREVARSLLVPQGQYTFLRYLLNHLWDSPEPADFHSNREGVSPDNGTIGAV